MPLILSLRDKERLDLFPLDFFTDNPITPTFLDSVPIALETRFVFKIPQGKTLTFLTITSCSFCFIKIIILLYEFKSSETVAYFYGFSRD